METTHLANFARNPVNLQNNIFTRFLASLAIASVILVQGCAVEPTFPSDTVVEQIEAICKELYDLDVIARVNGGTMGAMLYMDTMLDEAGTAIPKSIHEKLGNLTSVVSRAALSTDRKVNFVVVGVRGRSEQIELLIVRNLVDVKKAQTEALSITESMKRTVFKQSRYSIEDPAKEVFDLEDLSLEDFLVQQILQRIRYGDQSDKEKEKDAESKPEVPTELYDGRFLSTPNGNVFDFSLLSFQANDSLVKLQAILIKSKDVIGGYGFRGYDKLILRDLLNGRKIELDKETVDACLNDKLSVQEIMDNYLEMDTNRSSMFKNALEVFGFESNGEPQV